MPYFKHPNALVETENIGDNTRVWAFAHILPMAKIGSDCNINDQTFIENDVIIGNHVTVKSGVYIWDGVRIEDHVFIGPNVTFTNDLRPRSQQYPESFAKTVVREWASLGANATVVAGIEIGRYAMIGAGSVVTKNIPDHTLWYGNPARMKGYVCCCGNSLETDYSCKNCGLQFGMQNEKLVEIK
ncbi:acyltransferase [Cohnella hashimotonis]|uniref:Acyltransferase n=1 Tax=Cohnella hashimotonis TaxID=2826895 RepID=A0ABT6TTW9_9BACL|nr:acyltransferase [Cohnella hashimotonis]MDI4650306.1 acyltransferase [Cohnella hashimotonis]